MPSHTETLLADVAGSNQSPTNVGSEIVNKASRRRIDFNEYGFTRLQWGVDSAGVQLRSEYSLDDGATWLLLTNPVPANPSVGDNAYGTWDPLPADLQAAPYSVLCRAVLTGSGGGIRVRYVTLQMR